MPPGEYVLDITNIRGNPANAFFNNNADRAFSYLPSAATSEITVIARCDADNVGQTVKTTLDAAFTDAGYKNFDVQLGPLSPSFSIADASVGESTGAATLTISLQPAASASTAVSWATADGTATAPADYTASSGTVLFAAGVTSKAVTVPVTDDAVDDPDETFSVTLSGPIGAAVISIISGSATVTIVDDQPPVAADDSYSVPEDQTLSVAALGVLANDTARPGLALTAAKVTDPSSGTLTLSPDGSFTYAPVSVSVQTFTYKANDGTLDSNVATVTINVTQGNRPPVAIDDFYAVTSGQVFTVSAPGVLDNDTDPDGDPLTAVLVTDIPAAEGAVALGTDGFFIYPTFPRSAAWVRRNPVRVLPI